MNFDLRKHTILLTVSGSYAYGLATPNSDLDLKGVCIPNKGAVLGFCQNFEQVDSPEHMKIFWDSLGETRQDLAERNGMEGQVYALRKFMKLAADANPNILEVLFCRDEEVLLCSIEGERLREIRNLFLSDRAAYSYSGYAISQLKRIKGHRGWLLNPKKDEPQRENFGLLPNPEIDTSTRQITEAKIRKFTDEGYEREEAIRLVATLNPDDYFLSDPNWIAKLNAEYRYGVAMRERKQYQEWVANRNPARAALEAKYGYDTKHAMHLFRLLRTGKELLTTGRLIVHRPDREELLAIRNGIYSYDEVIEKAEAMEQELQTLIKEKKSVLPSRPDLEVLNNYCVNLHTDFYHRNSMI